MKSKFGRRTFLKGAVAGGVAASMASKSWAQKLRYFQPTVIDNPLAEYPNRDWESVYRNIFKPDSHFVFLCAPNDTHNCLLKTYVKNGVAIRIGPTYGYGKAQDLYGNTASHRWDPRLCQKGLGLVRRIYGDRRVKTCFVRRGFKAWADAGFPRDPQTGAVDRKYLQRGRDQFLRVPWDDAYALAAKTMVNIAKTYSGAQGKKFLKAQGYDEAMIETMHEAGTQTLKARGGMAFLGATRIFALNRMLNGLALLDSKIRGVDQEHAVGGRAFDSYSWHTDLPPGHPMVTGQQTNEFDLFSTEYAKLIVCWGMNWISTKMPDSHWLTEARLKGAKTVLVTVEYSSTACKGDEVIIIRPGTDPAFALGAAQVVISSGLYDKDYVAKNTDLPFLIREDTLQPLRPEEVIEGYKAPELKSIKFLKKDEKNPPTTSNQTQFISEALAGDFKPNMIVDAQTGKLVPITRDQVGPEFIKMGITPDLKVKKNVKLLNGKTVTVRTVFNLTEEYLNRNMTPKLCSEITGAPEQAIVSFAKDVAANPEKTLIATGMGPNQFFNADLKDRAIFLLAALTRNIGFPGGNVGSYAGNYRFALFGGEPNYMMENPFNLQLDAGGKPEVKKFLKYESLHFFNYGDRPLKAGKHNVTGKTHMPTPTKMYWQSNSNSSLGNIKWHYDVVNNTLPKVELVMYSDWWWTGSCEYSDIVWGVDSWAEFKYPDMTGSCTNPFVQIFPRTPLERVFDTRSDIEVVAGVTKALGQEIGDSRLTDLFKFVHEKNVQVYLQRIIDGSSGLKGYKIGDLEANAKEGIPALFNNRSYPRGNSYEESKGERGWYTKTGRLEFYRPEKEWIDNGENMIVYREPVDSTFYEPNVIVAHQHKAIRPKSPQDYGVDPKDLSCEARQTRNVLVTPENVTKTQHPLRLKLYSHIYHTPKYRHGTHTTPVDTDYTSIWFGPFGDIYRHDKRMPSCTEGYVDINPLDARELGIDDGDYIHLDADPEDRPFRGWKKGTEEYKVARLMLRARFYQGTPRGVLRSFYNMYGATFGSVKGHETREDGLASNPETNYRSMFRYGSHQSATRAWLRPTLLTDSLIHKTQWGHGMEAGFAADIHCAVGAPREAFVKVTKAEKGGIGGKGKWRPAELGFRPTYENPGMKQYLKGKFLKKKA